MRIGVVGLSLAADYLKCLSTIPEIELVGVAQSESERQGRIERTVPEIPLYPEMTALFRQSPDGVIICAPTSERSEIIQAVAGATSFVLCEVPFAPALNEVQSALKVCRERRTALQPAFALRYMPTFQTLKQAIDDRKCGQVLGITATYQRRTQPTIDDVMQNLALHLIDLLHWLLGVGCEEVYAEIEHDNAVISLQFVNGTYATLDVSQNLPDSYSLNTLKMEIVGHAGSVRLDAFRQSVGLFDDLRRDEYWGSNPTMEMLRDFAHSIARRRALSVTPEAALHAQEIVQAGYRVAELYS